MKTAEQVYAEIKEKNSSHLMRDKIQDVYEAMRAYGVGLAEEALVSENGFNESDIDYIRCFLKFLDENIPIPQNMVESYGNYVMNIDSIMDRAAGKEDAKKDSVEFAEWLNKYYCSDDSIGWYDAPDTTPYDNIKTYTTSELFAKWKESKGDS